MKKNHRLLLKYIVACSIITIVTTIFSLISFNNSKQILNKSIEDAFKSYLSEAQTSIDINAHHRYKEAYLVDNIDELDVAFKQQTLGKLQALQNSISASRIYTVNLKENTLEEFYFVLDTAESVEQQFNKTQNTFLKKAINKPNSVYVKEFTNKTTGCLVLSNSNTIETLLCIDIPLNYLSQQLNNFIITFVLHNIFLAVAYTLIGYLVFRILKRNAIIQEKMEYMAYYDSLTSLPNRVSLIERLNEMVSSLKKNTDYSIALFFIDVDNFKKVNDSEGHIMGDILLQQIAKFLRDHSNLKPLSVSSKEFVARLGGDEFVLIYPVKNKMDIQNHANNILSDFLKFKADNQIMMKYNVSLSIGIATYPEDADNISSLLKAADSAMYRAKNEEKGTWSLYQKISNNNQ